MAASSENVPVTTALPSCARRNHVNGVAVCISRRLQIAHSAGGIRSASSYGTRATTATPFALTAVAIGAACLSRTANVECQHVARIDCDTAVGKACRATLVRGVCARAKATSSSRHPDIDVRNAVRSRSQTVWYDIPNWLAGASVNDSTECVRIDDVAARQQAPRV